MNQHTSNNQKVDRYILGVAPTPERKRHMGGFNRAYVKADGMAGIAVERYRARYPSPLDLYFDQQIIDSACHHAGLQFGRAYNHAVSGYAACVERSSRVNSADTLDMSDSMQLALDFVQQTYAVLMSDAGIVIDVCAYERPAGSPEALGKLRRGLGRLAREWGMAASELCQPAER